MEDKLTLVFRRCTGRRPTAAEIAVLARGLKEQSAAFAENSAAARTWIDRADLSAAADREVPAMAGWIVVSHVLLNLDETLTIE